MEYHQVVKNRLVINNKCEFSKKKKKKSQVGCTDFRMKGEILYNYVLMIYLIYKKKLIVKEKNCI